MSSTPITISVVKKAIKDWIASSTGFTTIWDFQNAPQPLYPYCALKLTPFTPLGLTDEVRQVDIGSDSYTYQCGQRKFVVSCEAFVRNLDNQGRTISTDPDADALTAMTKAQMELTKGSRIATLHEAGVAVIDRGVIQDISTLYSEEWISRAQMDVTFLVAFNVRPDTAETSDVIEKVRATVIVENAGTPETIVDDELWEVP